MRKNMWNRILACCFILIMLLSINAGAVNQTEKVARQTDLDYLYSTLKTNHPNLFANTPEANFEARKTDIGKRLETESTFDFLLDCASLAALAKDSHTSVSLGSNGYDLHICLFDLDLYDGTWILSAVDRAHQSLLGAEVTEINGFSMNQILEKFGTFLSADNPVKLRYSYWQMCYILEPYEYLGIAKQGEPLNVTVKDADGKAQILSVSSVKQSDVASSDMSTLKERQSGTPVTAYDKTRIYFAKALNRSTYYIQYNKCAEDESLPMETFCQQIQTDLDGGDYSLILIDLRNNGGGSDGVIAPLLKLLMQQRDHGVQVAGLIGRQTFSSAIINAVELQEMGFPLAGDETSGSVDHFGSVQSFRLPASGLRVGVSSKFISMSNYFDAASGKGVESLQPDVKIAQTLDDTLCGKDTCVEKILNNSSILESAERDEAPMTRGRFVGLLYQAVGKRTSNSESKPFNDLLGIEWYLPALSWAKAEQIAKGNSTGGFSAARALSWQEASVLLTRTAGVMGIQPTSVQNTALPEALKTVAWNQDAVQNAWKWGLLPENVDFSFAPTREQGETMVQHMLALCQ